MDPQTMESHVANFRYFQEQFNNLRTYDMQVREAIAELKDRSQTGTLQEYLEPFQSLLNDGWVEEELAINLFLGGLRAKIRNSLSFFQPSTLHNAYLLAKLQEFIHGHDDFSENASDQIEVGQEQEESDCNYQSENIPHQIKIEQEQNIPHQIKIEQEQVESDSQYHYDVGSFEAASPENHVREVSGKELKELRISNSLIQANPKLWPFEVVVDHDDKYVEDGESDKEKKMVACGSQKEPESDSFDKEYGDMSQMGQLLSISLMRTGVLQTNNWFSTDGDLALVLMLARVQRKHGYLLVINVAHETIACGKRGGCVAEAFIYREDIIICVGTRSTVIGNRGGLTACSPRRKPLMLSRGHVTMFSTISPILFVVVAHATVTVARKEAWCRRKKRAKELHARRFLAVTFEFATVMARRLKPPWEFGFLAIDAAKRVLTQEAIYYDLLASSIEAYLVTKDVDVTVPTCSCSNEFQRKATKDVEFNIGLNVTHVINRPIDAAIGYSFDKKINSFSEQNRLIFDPGGRILVVFFLTIGEGIFEMKTTAGNTFLSGVWVLLKLRCSLGRYRGFRFKVGHIQKEENLMSELSMWHCPACRDGSGAIDWYQGLQPLISQVTTMGPNRIKLHEEFEEIVEEELRQLETSIVVPSELFSGWKGLSAQGKDHDIIWSPMVIIMYTRLVQDENDKWSMGKAEILNCFDSDKPLKGQGTFDCGHVGDNEGICESWVLVKVILLPNTICIIAARHVVTLTMDVGRTYKSEELQKQMFVVILSGWSMICFGHKLIKPWEVNLQENFPHNDHLKCWDKPRSMMEKWPLTVVNTSAPGAEVAVKTAALLASTSLVLKTDSLENAADLFGKEGCLGSSMACRVNDLNACLFYAGNGYWMVQEELPTSGGNFYKFSLCLASHVRFMKSCPFLFSFFCNSSCDWSGMGLWRIRDYMLQIPQANLGDKVS